MFIILVNCITLAMYDPYDRRRLHPQRSLLLHQKQSLPSPALTRLSVFSPYGRECHTQKCQNLENIEVLLAPSALFAAIMESITHSFPPE